MQQDYNNDDDDYGFSGSNNSDSSNAENGSNDIEKLKGIINSFNNLSEEEKRKAVSTFMETNGLNIQIKLELPGNENDFVSFKQLVDMVGKEKAIDVLIMAMTESKVQFEAFSKQEVVEAARAVSEGNATERQKLIIDLIKSTKVDDIDKVMKIMLEGMAELNKEVSSIGDILLPSIMIITVNYLYDKRSKYYSIRSNPEKAFDVMEGPAKIIDAALGKMVEKGTDKTIVFLGALLSVLRFGKEELPDVPLQHASIIAKEFGLYIPGVSDNKSDDSDDDGSLINDFCGSNDEEEKTENKKPSNKSIKSMMMDI